jgi:hypothetical protein
MLINADPKDPSEVKTYTVDWTPQLNSGATISTSTWVLPTGITNSADGIVSANTATSILLSGGTHNTDYACINRITTSDGETLEQTGLLRVRNS